MNTLNPLSIQGLTKRYDGMAVLDDLDLELTQGAVLGLLGRNGSGKTTLMECALGLRSTNRGTVQVMGANPLDLPDEIRAKVGYVPQSGELFEWLTPRQMLNYFASFYSTWNSSKVEGLLSRWQIDSEKVIGKLSVGQKQRLSIIRALAPEPSLLVLDEPVAALDPAARRDFLRELVDSVQRGTTILFSTHILTDLERIALDVAVLRQGKIALHLSLDELSESIRKVSGPSIAISIMPKEAVLKQSSTENGSVTAILRVNDDQQRMLDGLASRGVQTEPLSLEDIFVELTQ